MLESPAMDDAMLLDGLLILIVLLFVPIGSWRGVAREAIVVAGVLAGAAVAAAWARPWGADLAELTGMDVGVAQFSVAMVALLGSTLLLGYGGSVVAHAGAPGLAGRIFGGLLGAVNGVLLTAYTLRFVDRFLADQGTEQAIDESVVARVLVEEFGWVMLALVTSAGIAVLGAFLLRRRSAPALAPAAESVESLDARTPRAPRLAWGRDDDKVEPAGRGYDPASGRYAADAPSVHQTVAMPAVDPQRIAVDRAEPHTDFAGGEWFERAAALRGGTGAESPARSETSGGTRNERCPACGEVVRSDEAFCPRCGRTLRPSPR